MKEDFLHFIWQQRLFDTSALSTTDGAEIVVAQVGSHNHSSGPDFDQARVVINQTLWVGSVEIHLKSSDWYAHKHQYDQNYNNVILHVVYEHDIEVSTQAGAILPTLELRGRIKRHILDRYNRLQNNSGSIPCAQMINSITEIEWINWYDRLISQRLQRKTNDVALLMKATENHWLEVLYTMLGGFLAGNLNKLAMYELCRKVPFALLAKYKDDHLSREALLLGCAGLLNHENPKAGPWLAQYEFLVRKHKIQPIAQGWRTGRVRPDQAPVNRIVQLSGLVPSIEVGLANLLQSNDFSWENVELDLSDFWHDHSNFNVRKRHRTMNLSKGQNHLLTINVHAPFIFEYALVSGDEALRDKALDILVKLPPEKNSVISGWNALNIVPTNALESQALLELKSQFCLHKKCVNCAIGKSLIFKHG